MAMGERRKGIVGRGECSENGKEGERSEREVERN